MNIEERIPKLKNSESKGKPPADHLYSALFTMMLIIIYLQTPISKVSKVEIKGNKTFQRNRSFPFLQSIKDRRNLESEQAKAAEKIEQNKLIKKPKFLNNCPTNRHLHRRV
ncbi:hypothetical protein PO124_01615 [Bacillus licheniformis]|nr:hypothetical protein [Bacillus licheniformis]